MPSINNTLPLDYFTTIASSCIWIFFNLNLTTRVLGRKLLLACRTLGSLERLGHACWSRSLTRPHAGLARLLGRERWLTKFDDFFLKLSYFINDIFSTDFHYTDLIYIPYLVPYQMLENCKRDVSICK